MLIFLHQLSKEVRICNRYFFFHWKNMFWVRRKDCKKGEVLAPFPANYFLKKNGLKIIFLHTAEAVDGWCSVKKVLLEIWQNSQENICGRVSLQLYWKRDSSAGVFLWILPKFLNTFSYRTPPIAASDTGIFENRFLF